MDEIDTIAAIATAPGEAGIAVIRVSGPDALRIADRMAPTLRPAPSTRPAGTFALARIVEADGAEADRALVLIMRAPHSYTGEETVEFQCHGGAVVSRRILRAAIASGARPAAPGEFTRRAFLNGRMDLLQAEAVLDLIRARSDRAASFALAQLEGELSREIDGVYDRLIAVAADLEATLDFSDDELPAACMSDIAARLDGASRGIEGLLARATEGRLLREGAVVVISGRPNVGKSSLMNALLGHDRTIVSPTPGTTRDTVEESLVLDGIRMVLVDTAGLRDAACDIEREGIRRTRRQMQRARIHLHAIDASRELTDEDRRNLDSLDPKSSLVVLNKSDLGLVVRPSALSGFRAEIASMKTGEGLDAIRRAAVEILTHGEGFDPEAHTAVSERHRALLDEARREVDAARVLVADDPGEAVAVLAANHLRAALEAIGRITGKVVHDSLLDAVFSRFCVGK